MNKIPLFRSLFSSIADQIFSCGILPTKISLNLSFVFEYISKKVKSSRYISQNTCVEKTNISIYTLRRIENNYIKNVSVQTLLNIANAIGLSVNDLLPTKTDTLEQIIADIYSIAILQEFYLL